MIGTEEVQAQLVQDILAYLHDPEGFVEYIFPWGAGELEGSSGPRDWQRKVLGTIGAHLKNLDTRFQPLLVSVASGKGIGKSALVAMLTAWGLSTCDDCKIILTANTDTQLRTKTWPEIGKWFRLALNSHWWSVEAESISIKDAKHRMTWRCDRIPWTENNTEAFAGLHNQGKRIIVIFDEASAIADKIWEVVEGALTDENTEIIWLAFGNPTRTEGRFRECFGKYRHRWRTFQIDSRQVEGTNKKELQQQIEDYGEESDHVKIWIKGEFPSRSSTQFIGSDLIERARLYKAVGFETMPKILSVDVARFGDDQSVVCLRQGRKAIILAKYRNLDAIQMAERTIKFIEEQEPAATIVDGDGYGASVADQLRMRGYGQKLYEYHGQHKADDDKFFNKRSECWGRLKEWLQQGAELPDDKELCDDLLGPEYTYSVRGQIQLERKDFMKNRGLASPDCGDALAMGFFVNIAIPKKKESKPLYGSSSHSETAWMA